jgi:hypothetical protein
LARRGLRHRSTGCSGPHPRQVCIGDHRAVARREYAASHQVVLRDQSGRRQMAEISGIRGAAATPRWSSRTCWTGTGCAAPVPSKASVMLSALWVAVNRIGREHRDVHGHAWPLAAGRGRPLAPGIRRRACHLSCAACRTFSFAGHRGHRGFAACAKRLCGIVGFLLGQAHPTLQSHLEPEKADHDTLHLLQLSRFHLPQLQHSIMP